MDLFRYGVRFGTQGQTLEKIESSHGGQELQGKYLVYLPPIAINSLFIG